MISKNQQRPQLLKLSIRCNGLLVRITGLDREIIPLTGNETVINLIRPFNTSDSHLLDYQSRRITSSFIPVSWLRIGFVQPSTINSANKALLAALKTILTCFLLEKLTHFSPSFCPI